MSFLEQIAEMVGCLLKNKRGSRWRKKANGNGGGGESCISRKIRERVLRRGKEKMGSIIK